MNFEWKFAIKRHRHCMNLSPAIWHGSKSMVKIHWMECGFPKCLFSLQTSRFQDLRYSYRLGSYKTREFLCSFFLTSSTWYLKAVDKAHCLFAFMVKSLEQSTRFSKDLSPAVMRQWVILTLGSVSAKRCFVLVTQCCLHYCFAYV